jgi:hypothetical protein
MAKTKKHKMSKEEIELIEKKVAEIKSFLEQWFSYMKMFKGAFYGDSVTREREDEFLKMKCNLARRHEYLMFWLDQDYISVEPITKILCDTLTLNRVSSYKKDFYVKIETAWHRVLLNIARTQGHFRVLLDESLQA